MTRGFLPAILFTVLLAGCAPAPPAAVPKPDPAKEAWYGETANRLAALAQQADAAFRHGKPDEAAQLITQCRPLMDRLLSAPQPTLAAMQAISDVDQLYGQMLLGNGHYVWARDFFQKNLTRWSTWKPQTAETGRRLAVAHAAIAECDRRMKQ